MNVHRTSDRQTCACAACRMKHPHLRSSLLKRPVSPLPLPSSRQCRRLHPLNVAAFNTAVKSWIKSCCCTGSLRCFGAFHSDLRNLPTFEKEKEGITCLLYSIFEYSHFISTCVFYSSNMKKIIQNQDKCTDTFTHKS